METTATLVSRRVTTALVCEWLGVLDAVLKVTTAALVCEWLGVLDAVLKWPVGWV